MSSRSFFSTKGFVFFQTGFEDRAIAALSRNHVNKYSLERAQVYAWREELSLLHPVAEAFPNCTIALEYMIPRMGKRVDAVILIENAIFILEFKIGEEGFPTEAQTQLEDYRFDLINFHEESHSRRIVPILVCYNPQRANPLPPNTESAVLLSSGLDLLECLRGSLPYASADQSPLNHETWLNSVYKPTPTIIEAAQALYEGHQVEDITRKEASQTNIDLTTQCVNSIINATKAAGRKAICFLTGVPGSGKTLVGLNIASTRRNESEGDLSNLAVFLSGNGPLIEVLQASLVEDQERQIAEHCRQCRSAKYKPPCNQCTFKKTKTVLQGEVKAFVQGVHLFREEYFNTVEPPAEHIAIFDEAQRAWSEEQLSKKMKTRWQNKRDDINKSEPQVLIDYLDRHQDWAVIVCLVGGGQEIHDGEAGIIEWFNALNSSHPDWDIYVSSAIESDNYLDGIPLSEISKHAILEDGLHLSVDMRSFRNINVAAFAETLVKNQPYEAKRLYENIAENYPIYVTRDLQAAKEWVRHITKRPSDRYGIIADSYGQRIRADGIIVPTLDFNAVKWFLRGKDDIDSSYFMEIAASEFKIQGLEIDYAVIAWEGDFRYVNGQFEYHRFFGGGWQNVNSEMNRRYLLNGYRVLLTRARQGYVIYVPSGSKNDPTRKPSFYDETFEYLIRCGIQTLPHDVSRMGA